MPLWQMSFICYSSGFVLTERVQQGSVSMFSLQRMKHIRRCCSLVVIHTVRIVERCSKQKKSHWSPHFVARAVYTAARVSFLRVALIMSNSWTDQVLASLFPFAQDKCPSRASSRLVLDSFGLTGRGAWGLGPLSVPAQTCWWGTWQSRRWSLTVMQMGSSVRRRALPDLPEADSHTRRLCRACATISRLKRRRVIIFTCIFKTLSSV